MKSPAEPCPWCSAPFQALSLDYEDEGVRIWFVRCNSCGAEGPHPAEGAQTPDEAIAVWNGERDPVIRANQEAA